MDLNMKIREICELVKEGKITLNEAGHSTNLNLKRFIDCYNDHIEKENGKYDGKWNGVTDEVMREHFKHTLDREVEQEDSLTFFSEQYCFGCGQRLKLVLTGDKLQLRQYFEYNKEYPTKSQFLNHPIDYVCPFSEIKPFTGEINVSSDLVFANYFDDCNFGDAPEGKQYSDEWSLNCVAGRYRIAEYKAKQNIAYGQMSNMSIGIYVNKDRDSVIVGPAYHPADYEEYESDEEYQKAASKPVFPGYKQVNKNIDLTVWRWEAADFKTIKESYKKDEMIRLKVKHGTWLFQHNYDTLRKGLDEKDIGYVFAKFDLKK
jgi:hypothetical protein